LAILPGNPQHRRLHVVGNVIRYQLIDNVAVIILVAMTATQYIHYLADVNPAVATAMVLKGRSGGSKAVA
jgi:hypothetical protein